MIYCFDLDGTICTDTQGDYGNAEAYPEVVAAINRLHDEGHQIIVMTARGSATGKDWRVVTESQLLHWGVAYDRLYLGKPPADVYVDDKAVNISEFRLAVLGRLTPHTAPALMVSSPAAPAR